MCGYNLVYFSVRIWLYEEILSASWVTTPPAMPPNTTNQNESYHQHTSFVPIDIASTVYTYKICQSQGFSNIWNIKTERSDQQHLAG